MRHRALLAAIMVLASLVLPEVAGAAPPIKQTPRASGQLQRAVPPANLPPAPGTKPALPPQPSTGTLPRVPAPWEGPAAPPSFNPAQPWKGRTVGPMPKRTRPSGTSRGAPGQAQPHGVDPSQHTADPAAQAGHVGEAVGAAPELIRQQLCFANNMSKLGQMQSFFKGEQAKYPQGQPFWVSVTATLAGPGTTYQPSEANKYNCPGNESLIGGLDPYSFCILKMEMRDLGTSPPSEPPDMTRSCRQRKHFQLVGTGQRIVERPDVALSISPQQKSLKLCQAVSLAANVTVSINGRRVAYDANHLGISWRVNGPGGLQRIDDQAYESAFVQAGSTSSYQLFRALKPGAYTVVARLFRVDPKLFGGNPLIARMLADQFEVTFATAQVTVAEPTLKGIQVLPSFARVAAGGSTAFKARAFYEEPCYKPQGEDITKSVGWTIAQGEGTMSGPVYTASKPVPAEMTIHPNKSGAKYEPCDVARFSAKMTYQKPEDATVRATYAGESFGAAVDEAPVTVTYSGGASDVSRQVSWNPGQEFDVGGEPGEKLVSAEFPEPYIREELTIKVAEPKIDHLEVSPSKATLEVSGQRQFSALGHYKEKCVEPVTLEAADGLSWSTGSHGSVSPDGLFEASVPGTDTLVASLSGGPTGKASIAIRTPGLDIVPPKATLTLGQEMSFKAMLQPYTDVTNREATAWKSGPVFEAKTCGTFPVSATYTDPETSDVRSDTANVSVKVDPSECVAIREALAASFSPDHLSESKKWLTRRQELIEMGCGNCGVEPTWTSGGSETEVVEPEDGDGQPEGCSDPRRRSVKQVSTDGEEVYTCGSCKKNFIPIRRGDGELSCETGDEIASAASCPAGTSGQFDPASGNVGCCPPNTVWNPSQNTCEGLNQPPPGVDMTPVLIGIIGAGIATAIHERDRRRRRPRRPPKKKCHKRPDGTWHCGSG